MWVTIVSVKGVRHTHTHRHTSITLGVCCAGQPKSRGALRGWWKRSATTAKRVGRSDTDGRGQFTDTHRHTHPNTPRAGDTNDRRRRTVTSMHASQPQLEHTTLPQVSTHTRVCLCGTGAVLLIWQPAAPTRARWGDTIFNSQRMQRPTMTQTFRYTCVCCVVGDVAL